MAKLEIQDECFKCNTSRDIGWVCPNSGDVYCDDCAEENNYECETCGTLLVPIEEIEEIENL